MLFLLGRKNPAIRAVVGALVVAVGLLVHGGAVVVALGAVLIVWAAVLALKTHRAGRPDRVTGGGRTS